MKITYFTLILSILAFSTGCKKELVDTSLNDIEDITGVDKFNNSIATGVTMAFFHADWCHHCEEFRPKLRRLAKIRVYTSPSL